MFSVESQGGPPPPPKKKKTNKKRPKVVYNTKLKSHTIQIHVYLEKNRCINSFRQGGAEDPLNPHT